MTTIIAGMFDTVDKADGAVDQLRSEAFAETDVCSFANNPPGQHDAFPIGGDEDEDPGATHADSGAGKGAAVGAVVAGPPGAAVGAGIGAYVGSLVGALHGLEGRGTEDHPVRRPAGIVVAVRIENGKAEHSAIDALKTRGAIHIEKAEGQWRDGAWIDFDPVSAPIIIHSSTPVNPA